jgi:hypothetical protein
MTVIEFEFKSIDGLMEPNPDWLLSEFNGRW